MSRHISARPSFLLLFVGFLLVAAIVVMTWRSPETAKPSALADEAEAARLESEESGRLLLARGAQSIDGRTREELVLLDDSGGARAVGRPRPLIGALAACPGSRYFLDVRNADGVVFLDVRRLSREMRLVRRIRLPIGPNDASFFGEVACFASSGRRAVVFISEETKNDDKSRLLRVDGRTLRLVHRGDFSDAVLIRGTAFLFRTYAGPRAVIAVGLRRGRERVAARLPRPPQSVAVSADGRSLAAIVQRPNPFHDPGEGRAPPTMNLFNARTGARRAVIRLRGFPLPTGIFDRGHQDRPDPPRPCPPSCGSGEAVWLSNGIVAFVPHVWPGRHTDVFTRRGEHRGQLSGFYGEYPVVLGDRLYAIASGRTVEDPDAPYHLRTVRMAGGRAKRLAIVASDPDLFAPHHLVAAP